MKVLVPNPPTTGAGIVFTTKAVGNLSFSPPAAAAEVADRRRQLSQALGIPAEWATARQVHGRVALDAAGCPVGAEADALVTRDPHRPVAVLVGDCVPISLSAPGIAAAVHAGWRGLCRGIIDSAVGALGPLGSPCIAWIGPCIGPCCYEVGPEVPDQFAASHPAAPDCRVVVGSSLHFDLRKAAVAVLEAAGVMVAGEAHPPCTRCDARFFSYRRDATASRQALITWLPASQ